MLEALAPARRRLVMVASALAVLAAVAVVVALVKARDVPLPSADQSIPGPVLLIPGYGGSRASLEVLADALRSAGRDVTIVVLAGDGTGDLNGQAQALDRAVVETLERTGATSVDLVGYSAGGVMARLWVNDFDGARAARRVVTLGSPHHGSNLAGLAADLAPDACPQACAQLAPDSELLRRLNRRDETPSGPEWISLWSANDQTVQPPSSAQLGGGALNIEIQKVCPEAAIAHGELPRSPIVRAMLESLLGPGEPRTPGERVCRA